MQFKSFHWLSQYDIWAIIHIFVCLFVFFLGGGGVFFRFSLYQYSIFLLLILAIYHVIPNINLFNNCQMTG